ncbi:MAG: GMC family oxidoreductase [Cyclobacteriaceae bacterium]|nr:GMC family oxidoreductase [Cyclobacteriaceae bacterium]
MPKDICIIGAGLAGGIIAQKLTQAGHKVTLVDMGDQPEYIEPEDEEWRLDKPQAAFTRGQGFGGTSNFWHGGLTHLDDSDVSGLSSLFNEPKYPISRDELIPYYRQATEILRGDCKFDFEDILRQPQPTDNGFEINFDLFRYKGLIYPRNAYSSSKAIYQAASECGLKLIKNFTVSQINIDDSGVALEIEGCHRIDDREYTKKIRADHFILAAGGIGSPKILLKSIHKHPILKNLPVGRFITDHPTGFVFKAKLKKRLSLKNLFAQPGQGYRTQFGFTLQPGALAHSNHQNHILYLRPAITMKDPLLYDYLKRRLVGYKGKNIKLTDIFYLFKHVDLLYEAVNFRFGLFNTTRCVSGLTFLEQLPNHEDNITLQSHDRFSINWKISQKDELSSVKFLETFFKAHDNIFDEFQIFPNISRRLESSGHHSGGCRMSSSPETGVVDANLKVFNTENLYVADGSTLPYTGHANTGLSIAAMAIKCSNFVNSG